MAQDGGHASERMVHVLDRQADEALVAAMVRGRHVLIPGDGSVGGSDHLHVVRVDVADGICPRAHRAIVRGGGRGRGSSSSVCSGNAVLSSAALGGSSTAGALPSVPWARGGGGGLVKLLLVAQQQVPTSKASCALGTLKGLLLGVRAFVPLQMLEAGEGALAGSADMRTRLVGLGRRKGRGRGSRRGSFGGRVHGDGGCWGIGSHCQ